MEHGLLEEEEYPTSASSVASDEGESSAPDQPFQLRIPRRWYFLSGVVLTFVALVCFVGSGAGPIGRPGNVPLVGQSSLQMNRSAAVPAPLRDLGSCASYGCGSFSHQHSCQCNGACQQFGSCCGDYYSRCTHHDDRRRRRGSCASYGCGNYNQYHTCQCSSQCHQHHNCCGDYDSKCVHHDDRRRRAGSCAEYGCDSFSHANGCQCNSECHQYNSCCGDYDSRCKNPSPAPTPTRRRRRAHHPHLVNGSKCIRAAAEYGNKDKGSCDWAPVVGIHCSKACLEEIEARDWLPEDADLSEITYNTSVQCQEVCASVQGCEYFAFQTISSGAFQRACWLKGAVPVPQCDNPYALALGFESGPKKCSVTISTTTTTALAVDCFKHDMEYGNEAQGSCGWGHLVGLHCSADCATYLTSHRAELSRSSADHLQYETPFQCQSACQSLGNCSYFSFDTKPGRYYNSCWLRAATKCEHGYAISVGVISGPRECTTTSTTTPTTSSTTEATTTTETTTTIGFVEGSTCIRAGMTYGNKNEGSCEWAHLVALLCGGGCVQEMKMASWFPRNGVLGEIMYNTSAQCQEACAGFASCQYFTFDVRQGVYSHACWLFAGLPCDPAYASASGFESGPRQCANSTTVTTTADASAVENQTFVTTTTAAANPSASTQQTTTAVLDTSTSAQSSTTIAANTSAPSQAATTGVAVATNTSTTGAPVSTSTILVNSCVGEDMEYGNMDHGACGWADLVGLHCSPECVFHTQSQAWFPRAADKKRVKYESALECQQACQNVNGCEYFSFDTRPGQYHKACWMKASISCTGDAYGRSPGIQSGPRVCPVASTTTTSTTAAVTVACSDAVVVPNCHGQCCGNAIEMSMRDVREHPENFPGLSANASFYDVQLWFYDRGLNSCGLPCTRNDSTFGSGCTTVCRSAGFVPGDCECRSSGPQSFWRCSAKHGVEQPVAMDCSQPDCDCK